MPGGALHVPVFGPYALYGRVDHIYGAEAWAARNGFTAAQASLNVVESVGYVGYLFVVWRFGGGGRGGEEDGGKGKGMLGMERERGMWDRGRMRLGGGWGGVGCLVGFALSVMTVSKTVLYCERPSIHPSPFPMPSIE